ncbi:UNVERIFIED_ORG: hypothetical protein ABIC62_006266 [Burkholderia sp. 1595]|uniref:Uncharacterized protein n=1 Tax=Paraburkholderia terricola TaxID=169427 RepID=A0ABU1M0B4_9BURK|nr:hypothetical protein [Paraburkholderia terricola]MDR6412301.1 hypothetical protein [Paraburkholderia terricola]
MRRCYPTGLRLINFFFTAAWWTSTVIGAIVLNLFAAYAKDILDRALRAMSRKWATRSRRSREEFQRTVRELAASSAKRERFHREERRWRSNAIFYLLLTVALAALLVLGIELDLQQILEPSSFSASLAPHMFGKRGVGNVGVWFLGLGIMMAFGSFAQANAINDKLAASDRLREEGGTC